MILSEHKNGYRLALKYFPGCFDKHLRLKKKGRADECLSKKFDKLWHKNNINYDDFLEGYEYIEYLKREQMLFSDIKSREIKALYMKYDNLLSNGKKDDQYLLLFSIIKIPVLYMLSSMDTYICVSNGLSEEEKAKIEQIKNFISLWNTLLFNDRHGYNYISLPYFIMNLQEIVDNNSRITDDGNVLKDVLSEIRVSSHVLKRKK